ncbi:diacylglycerol/lipid kinase family protein [Halosimplex aquaticum]|uniref:Diacylglycerol/lipid kinase family protein n=1 Tax=Halosimplex aquaticum TaxID=3026162 RepID=A0ABD5XVY6_9EURY|nr:YegS/Rv2252/BmrU family lipid kinase [Halosimplex aquaticum]
MRRVMVRNPTGGDGTDVETARERASERGIDVRDSDEPGDAVALARAAAAEADQIIACGGDGTVNEVVRGVAAADALDDVELAVVPAGTGNNFAANLGIESVEHAFEVAETGERRRLDLGVADDALFVNSCLGGLIAEASEDTDDEAKARIGSLAYALQTLSDARQYEGPLLEIRAGASHDPLWSGTALVLLIGNGRRFLGGGRTQANLEDGRLEVVIVEQAPAIDYLAEGALQRLLKRDASHLTRLTTAELLVTTTDRPMAFSFDGEIVERQSIDASVREGAMRFRVGDAYEPEPAPWPPE